MPKQTQFAVSAIIRHKEDFLFISRSKDKAIDPGKLNLVGGKVEPKENIIHSVLREVQEETGLILQRADLHFAGVTRIAVGDSSDDWFISFYEVIIQGEDVPDLTSCEEGELVWIKGSELAKFYTKMLPDMEKIFDGYLKGQIFFGLVNYLDGETLESMDFEYLE